jgi:hypothetical protein
MEDIPQEQNIKIVYIHKPYESQIRANEKYREKNKMVIQERQRNYCKNRYNNDEEYKNKKKEQSKERYYKSKNKQE